VFYLTLHNNSDPKEKVIISPEFKEIPDAVLYMDQVVSSLVGEMKFYLSEDGLSCFNDDFTISVESDREYHGIRPETKSDYKLSNFEWSVDTVMDFVNHLRLV